MVQRAALKISLFSGEIEASRHRSMQCVMKQGRVTPDLGAVLRMT
jgi:hypothetical protein